MAASSDWLVRMSLDRSDSADTSAPQTGTRNRGCAWGCGLVGCVFFGCVAIGFWAAYQASQEELNLHHTLFAIRLVDAFVVQHGRWPKSWSELEAMPFDSQTPRSVQRDGYAIFIGGAMEFEWPRQAPEFRQRVVIDFDATPEEILIADVEHYQPVRPNGAGFVYWKYGFIEDLQETVRRQHEQVP